MEDDGYTLAEALAALLMIGLAIGGLLEGMSVIGRLQARATASVNEGQSLRQAERGLSNILRGAGPFASNTAVLDGRKDAMAFDCAGGARCRAALGSEGPDARLSLSRDDVPTSSVVLRNGGGAHFVYIGDVGRTDVWPPADANIQGRQTLRAIDVVKPSSAGDDVLLHMRVWSEQPVQCAYDMIAGECRS